MNAHKFINTEKLYHYTTFDTAIKILLSQELRFARLARMNDIYESSKHIGICGDAISNISEITKIFNRAIGCYQQISLTEDKGNKMGFNIPMMWGHYADKGNGVCIIFDKQQLLKKLQTKDLRGSITYNDDFNNWDISQKGEILQGSDVVRYLHLNASKLFMTKTEDWEHEQEYRIVRKSRKNQSLSIKGCVLGVLLSEIDRNSQKFNDKCKILEKIGAEVMAYCNLAGYVSIHNNKEEQIYPDLTGYHLPSQDEIESLKKRTNNE